jgi:hypothetical protein
MGPASFVFLDEAGAATDMARRHGWGPEGQRLVDAAPHGHWRATTFVAGLRGTGIIAPLVLDGLKRIRSQQMCEYLSRYTHNRCGVDERISKASHKICCAWP